MRQRTSQACDCCRRRKQKCDGRSPCEQCRRREVTCSYEVSERPTPRTLPIIGSPPHKRRQNGTEVSQTGSGNAIGPAAWERIDLESPMLLDHRIGESPTSEREEEADVSGQSRLMLDNAGKVLYFGDSATLSYLQLIRMIVGSVIGESPFTQDPDRHRFNEPPMTAAETTQSVPMLPEKRVADILSQSFFTNTLGMINIFDRRAFLHELNSCYTSPLTADKPHLVLIYLVLAIGLVMATPTPGSPEYEIIHQLYALPTDRAEAFFQCAKSFGDPLHGFEDRDLWSVQALCLMSFYMLVVSKPNAAHSYLSMAVQTGYVLGLHKANETDMVFEKGQPQLNFQRRIVWRSLFVLDRFLAMSLGRPLAISEDDCSDDSLEAPKVRRCSARKLRQEQILSTHGIDSGIQASRIIGQTLKKIYSKGKISTKVAEDIARDCKRWAQDLHPGLDISTLSNEEISKAYGAAILQVRLLGYHAIILLTRPFLLHLIIKADASNASMPGQHSWMKQFSETCVTTSTYTIQLAHMVLNSNCLPCRNPFVIYFIFSAALILLSNEFACLHGNVEFTKTISDAIDIMSHCATTDFQARDFHRILSEFREVVCKRTQIRTRGEPSMILRSIYPAGIPAASPNNPAEILPSSYPGTEGSWMGSSSKPAMSQTSRAPIGSDKISSGECSHLELEFVETGTEAGRQGPPLQTAIGISEGLEHTGDLESTVTSGIGFEVHFEDLWRLQATANDHISDE
ncbi:fungal-specific transcription factor domain-containing protein [Mariannaea sp. PMI_226]|nr:fungal-specific transcription factor domain-containing protein [Mariannaea sp. PMI_226]